jgi:hypothetical protein
MLMSRILSGLALLTCSAALTVHAAQDTLVFEGRNGPGKGKHVVLLAGDEEYRSEEALPMLAKILSQRHGFTCTVLFSVDANGTVNPENGGSLSGSEALASADVIVMSLRFRHWGDDAMKRFEKAYLSGVPMVALRTSTHAFNFPKDSAWAKYSYNAGGDWKGGFGRVVFGETWVAHHGAHKKEATRGLIEDAMRNEPVLRGVGQLFGTTDVYTANPPDDVKILVRGQVLTGMSPTDVPVDGPKNSPLQPIAWTRLHKNSAGKTNKILCTTMGSATDLQDESLRRLVVNGVFWGIGLEVPPKADVTLVDGYQPSFYGFKGHRKGLTVPELALGKDLPEPPPIDAKKK